MSFLVFVCRELMGPPVAGSCWRCPYCDSTGPSFSVRPPKDDPQGVPYPIKFKCHRCEKFGDEVDLVEDFYPEMSRIQVYRMLREMKHEYDRLSEAGPVARRGRGGQSASGHTRAPSKSKSKKACSSPPGSGTRERERAKAKRKK